MLFILVSHHHKPETGAHFRFDRLATYLIKSGHKVFWVSPKRDDYLKYKNVSFHCKGRFSGRLVSLRLFFQTLLLTFKLSKLRCERPVIITFGETNVLASLWVKLMVNGNLSIGVRSNVVRRHVLTRRGRFSEFKFKIKDFFLRVAYDSSKQIIVQTLQAKKDFLRTYGNIPHEKVDVINNDLPPSFINHAKDDWQLSKRPKLLFVGNDTVIKGVDVLLNACSLLDDANVDLTLVGVSSIKTSALEAKIPSPININVVEFSSAEEIASLMLNHELLVAPSREDQFPNVVLEGLALGMPIIGSKVDGIEFMLKANFSLFNPNDIDSVVSCLSFALTSHGYDQIKENSRLQRERFKFNWEEKYLRLIDNAVNNFDE